MMLYHILNDLKQTIDPKLVDDIIVGNVLQVGSGIAQIRMAALMAGFPYTTSAVSINRLCSSGIEAIATAADKIRAGSI
jgi:acetyl-CoA acyltransferase 1